MTKTLMQLVCDGEHGISVTFPPDGYMEMDAITTKADLRRAAKKAGWRSHAGDDYCETCSGRA